MRSCGLLFSWMRSLISDSVLPAGHLNSAFPSFVAGVSHRDTRIGLGTVSTPWFAWPLSAGILAVLSPLLAPSKTCPIPVYIPLSLTASWNGLWGWRLHWSMLWPAPLSVWFALVGGLAWTSWTQWVCPWWFRAWLALPHSTLSPALVDLSVPLLWGPVHSQWHWVPCFDTVGRGGVVQYPLQP